MAYPPDGDAPCGQSVAPDASHAPYTGEIKRIRATGRLTVVFDLCVPDVAFLAKIASPSLAIDDTAWLSAHVDPSGSGAGSLATEVDGTGPYRLEAWTQGTDMTLVRNEAYWGERSRTGRLIVSWRDSMDKRLDDLRRGAVDGIDDLDPAGVDAVASDPNLQLATRAGMNVLYVGFNDTFAPFDNPAVRQAIAMGIDRTRIVDAFYPPGSEVASHYAPCAIAHGCAGDPWYAYDPRRAKALLASAGYPNGFATTIQYRDLARPYLPDPTGVAHELQAQLLANLGIRAELDIRPDDGFLADADAGKLDGLHLLGQGMTYPDVSAFLDPRFGAGASSEFGRPFGDVTSALAIGSSTIDEVGREVAYVKANNAIRIHVPMIPIAHAGSAAAFRADVDGAVASPARTEPLASMTPGDRTRFVWLSSAEPAGLDCADEPDPAPQLVCSLLMEPLYASTPGGVSTRPSLAERCTPNAELTVWSCDLRPALTFHGGAGLDASDVVLSYARQWDAEHPMHRGRQGGFTAFLDRFGGFLHPLPAPGG